MNSELSVNYLRQHLKLLRPHQWIKNVFVLIPAFFAGKISLLYTDNKLALAFVSFCAIASAVYIINDIFDLEKDKILPRMRTDVVLNHPPSGRRIVIDTKFTSIVTSGWYREETLRSGYMYQIYAYLHSQVGRGDALADCASGLLLHPAIGQTVDETVAIQGHHIRFATVDLTASPAEIRSQLLLLCESTL